VGDSGGAVIYAAGYAPHGEPLWQESNITSLGASPASGGTRRHVHTWLLPTVSWRGKVKDMGRNSCNPRGWFSSALRLYWHVTVAVLTVVLLTGCQFSSGSSAYTNVREVLNTEVDALPVPPGSRILARYDGVSTGQVEACRGVVTELLVGNNLPASDMYQFYKDQLVTQGWVVTLDINLDEAPGVTLEKDGRYGIEVSDNYYVSTGIPRDVINSAEAQYESLVFIGIGYGVYDPEKCQQAIGER